MANHDPIAELRERLVVIETRTDRLHDDVLSLTRLVEHANEQRSETNKTLAVLAAEFKGLASRIEGLTNKISAGGGGGSSPAAMAATATIAAGLAVAASKVIPL